MGMEKFEVNELTPQQAERLNQSSLSEGETISVTVKQTGGDLELILSSRRRQGADFGHETGEDSGAQCQSGSAGLDRVSAGDAARGSRHARGSERSGVGHAGYA